MDGDRHWEVGGRRDEIVKVKCERRLMPTDRVKRIGNEWGGMVIWCNNGRAIGVYEQARYFWTD